MLVPSVHNTSLDFCDIAFSFSAENPPALGTCLSIMNFGIDVLLIGLRPPGYINDVRSMKAKPGPVAYFSQGSNFLRPLIAFTAESEPTATPKNISFYQRKNSLMIAHFP